MFSNNDDKNSYEREADYHDSEKFVVEINVTTPSFLLLCNII